MSGVTVLPSDSMSTTCPPTMPPVPEALAISATTSQITRESFTWAAFSATSRKARVSSASPARIAMASPNTLWLVSWPRR